MRKSLVALSVLAATALPSVVNAADYSDDIHKNDYKWMNSDSQDKSGSDDKMFMKFAPRFSLDGMTGKDLSFGPVQELYIATLMNWGGDNGGVNNYFIGLGSDVNVPWLGKIGLNLYGLYDANIKDWNGYQISTNWFKPFYTFANGTFLSYQGYIDYQFGMKKKYARYYLQVLIVESNMLLRRSLSAFCLSRSSVFLMQSYIPK